jgi:hypothetical protein
MDNGAMKKSKKPAGKKIKRPPRMQLTREEVIERMKTFSERKEQFLATARTGKG